MPLSKFSRKGMGPRDESPEAGPSKKDKYSSDEDDEPVQKKGDKHQSSKMSKQCVISKKSPGISNQTGGHGAHNKPAELFRKDLISAMKLADTEILYEDQYLVISDPWRQEWEKGVQVPVNEEEIPNISIVDFKKNDCGSGDFKIPPKKYMHEKNDETYQSLLHELTGMQELAEQIVRYDLDDQDVTWLGLVNEDREEMGLQLINEWNLERMIEELENQCYVKTNSMKKTEEGLGIEYDEDIACDVCRMLESEDTNEMVFCDGCDICVHQACYGIQTIPEGSWLCRICALSIKPMCLLCPKRGGAMKSTRSGTKWTHVSCALWIPEVSIGCPEKMEPITKISNIPASRWALVCCLCKERVGACIQCSVKQCKTAFHVTCGFAHNLDMKTILDDSDELDGIHLRAYCPKHTKNRNASDSESPKKDGEEDEVDVENEANEAEMARQRAEKLKQLDEEFYTLVDIHEIATKFYIPEEAVDVVAEYWKLKRKVNDNKPLITPKMEEEDQMQKQQKDSLSARMKMFVHLRQDLERARNLCYMIGKREKTKKQLFNQNERVFKSQITTLTDSNDLSARDADRIRQAYKFDSLYCTLSSTWSTNSKAPRKNLFTLENLKTPKDYSDNVSKSKDRKSLKSDSKAKKTLKSANVSSMKKEVYVDTVSVTSEESSSLKRGRESVFSTESLKILSDTTADSSEDDFMSCDNEVNSKSDSAQMSHLGKVKADQIETDNTEEKTDEKKMMLNDNKSKKIAGSDLKMRLTSILQSKSLMQRQDKLSEGASESFNQALHIAIENSDSEVFTDSNADFASPDQPRNLFDQFELKDRILNRPDFSSPELLPGTSKSSKHRKKRKGASSRKNKRNFCLTSPSDQSSLSSNSVKQEPIISPDVDSRPVSAECSSLLSEETERGKSLISPFSTSEVSETVNDEKPSELVERHRSPSKRRKSKKRLHKKREDQSPRHMKSPRSSSEHKTLKMSPSPRVDPDNTFGTVDGDIYVPSGKIQVTERIIVLDSSNQEKSRSHGKLRLKKQTNSPIKGVVSYEVVNNDFTDNPPCAVDGIKKDTKVESKLDIDDNTKGTNLMQMNQDKGLGPLSSSHQMLKEKNRKSDSKQSKLLSDSIGNVTKVLQDPGIEESGEKDSLDIIIIEKSPEKDVASRRSLRSVISKPHELDSSDENFIPGPEMPKSPMSDRSQRSHKSSTRKLRKTATDTDGGESDTIHSPSPKRQMSHRQNSSPVMKINPFPNRPELNALLDSSKLIVKESVKNQVGDRLSCMLKRRGRWGSRFGMNQLSLDNFVKPIKRSENIFAKVGIKSNQESVSVCNLSVSGKDQVDDERSALTKTSTSLVSSSISLNMPANGNVFGAHTSPKRGLAPGKLDDKSGGKAKHLNVEGDLVLWEVPSENSTSFRELRTRSPFKEEAKTPSKCDQTVINNDSLEVSRSYRSHSPISSEGSEASSRTTTVDSGEGTPRRSRRTMASESSQSPIAPGRLRNREGMTKPSPYKTS